MNPRAQLIAFQTIVIKEIARFFRIWQQTLLPPAITTSLYFVIFGNLIGPRIGQMDGFNYMDFISTTTSFTQAFGRRRCRNLFVTFLPLIAMNISFSVLWAKIPFRFPRSVFPAYKILRLCSPC